MDFSHRGIEEYDKQRAGQKSQHPNSDRTDEGQLTAQWANTCLAKRYNTFAKKV